MTSENILLIAEDPRSWGTFPDALKSPEDKVTRLKVQSISDLTSALPRHASVVFEWVSPDQDLKAQVLQQLDATLDKSVPIFSSAHMVLTSTMASWLQHPNRIIGFSPMGFYRNSHQICLSLPFSRPHFEIQSRVNDVLRQRGLTPVWIEDTAGMILPRIYAMLANEATFTLQEGVASAKDIDTAMTLGTNYPMGPLAWADQVGVDVVLAILNHLWQTYREERYRPCLLLQKMVASGCLGVRSGQGFFAYSPEQALPVPPEVSSGIRV